MYINKDGKDKIFPSFFRMSRILHGIFVIFTLN